MLDEHFDWQEKLTGYRCKVRDGVKINLESLTLATIDICTQTDNYILQDGFKSFPSGHSSGGLKHKESLSA